MKNKYAEKFEELVNKRNYVLLSDYITNSTKVKLKHNKCGHVYYTRPDVFQRGCGCPKCHGGVKYDTELFKQKMKDKVGNKFTLLEKYKGSKTPVNFKCNICGNTFVKQPVYVLMGHGCSYCSKQHYLTDVEFKNKVYDLVGDEYTIIDKYINNHTKIKIRHNICGKEYTVQPKDFTKKNGNRCPFCNDKRKQSLGEEKIESFLSENNIEFETQYKILNGETNRYLTFDFKLTEEETDNPIFIEFDGSLHYRSWNKSERNIKQFERQKRNDSYKNRYCDENNYLLIRIPY